MAEPESLAVIHEQLHGRRLAIAEDEDSSGERVVLEGFLTEPGGSGSGKRNMLLGKWSQLMATMKIRSLFWGMSV